MQNVVQVWGGDLFWHCAEGNLWLSQVHQGSNIGYRDYFKYRLQSFNSTQGTGGFFIQQNLRI